MAEDNIGIRPSTTTGSVKVATDVVIEDNENIHYPVYKLATGGDGEATLLGDNNKIPVTFVEETYLTNLLTTISKELKVMNLHLSLMTNTNITNEDIE